MLQYRIINDETHHSHIFMIVNQQEVELTMNADEFYLPFQPTDVVIVDNVDYPAQIHELVNEGVLRETDYPQITISARRYATYTVSK